MIYTLKALRDADTQDEPLQTDYCANGADVLARARRLLNEQPACAGVEVLMLDARLFFMPNAPAA